MKDLFKNYHYTSLKQPLTIIFILFFIISIVLSIVGFYYYDYQKEKIVNDRFEYLASISDFKKSQINDWLKGRYAHLKELRTNLPLVNKLISITTSQDNAAELKDWFKALKTFYQYKDIILIDGSLRVIYKTDSTDFNLNSIDSMMSIKSIDNDSVMFSDSDEKYTAQGPIKFFVPIGKSNILILTAEPQIIFNKILNRNIDKSPTFESLLVKPINDGIVYLNSLKFYIETEDSNMSHSRKALIEANTIKSRKGFINGIDYKNDEVIALIQKVPTTTWTLITKINSSEFYSPVYDLAKLVFMTIISADLLFAIILFFIWRKSILSNYKKVYAAEIEKSKVENRFESLVNGVKDIAIFILDHDGKVVSWNEGAGIIEGYTSEEIMGKHFSIFYTSDELNNNKPKDNLIFAAEMGSFQEEGWRIKKDGSVFWANVLITALKDEEGKVYGYLKVVRDLTEKRKGEEELRKSRDFYLKLLDDFPTPVWRSGMDGKNNYFNKAWLNYTGKTIEDEIGDGWIFNFHPEEREKINKLYNESFKQKKIFMMEHRLKNSNNEYRWMVNFGMPYFDIDNNFAGYLGSCYDIDDRKKYEETINTLLNIDEKLYASLEINQILDSLVTESIKLCNAESGFACVKNENEYIVKRYYHKDHWEYYDKSYHNDDNLIKRFDAIRGPILIESMDINENVDVEIVSKYGIQQVIAIPLFGSNGEKIGFFEMHNKKENKVFGKDDINLLNAVARNASVSIAKSLNYEQLREAERQLRASESELRKLTAQIQHAREAERQRIAREVHDELGQLFTGINLNISLLTELIEQNQKPTAEEIIDELHSVQQFVNKGIQTVRDISGSLRSYVLDHLGLVPAVQEYCREIERMSNVKCNFISEVESFNFCDERNVALFRIIQEGITNVLRHAEATIINVTIKKSNANLEIIISDNGKGIVESNEVTSNSMGILGMKERAIFLNGKLSIESVRNNGTTLHLLIPFE